MKELTKKEILIVLAVIGLVVFGISRFVSYTTLRQCEGVFPNPNIGGCGVYSQYDLDEKWCTEHGGRMFGRGFSGSECIFPVY